MNIGRGIRRYFAGQRPEGYGSESGAALMLVEDNQGQASAPGDDERMGEMDEERLQILRMLEERKITAEEASKLLAALDSQPARPAEPQATSTRARWLRVRVTDKATGRPKVNVNIPVSAVLALGKLGSRFGGSFLEKEGIDLEGVIEAIRSGAEGKIVDVDDENSRDHVEVIVE